MVREYHCQKSCYHSYDFEPEDTLGEYVVISHGRTKFWYKDNKRHKADGPAIEYVDGYKQYWYENKLYQNIKSDEEWIEFLKLKFLW